MDMDELVALSVKHNVYDLHRKYTNFDVQFAQQQRAVNE